MPDPIIVYPNSQNTKDFADVPNDALIPGIDPSRSGIDAGLFFRKSSLPFGGEGAVKHGHRRTLWTTGGAPGIVVPYDHTGDYASLLTVRYTPTRTNARIYVRASLRVTGDDGSQFSFIMIRRKHGTVPYHAIESASARQASLIGTNDSWDWYNYAAPIDNAFRLGFNSIPTVYESIFGPSQAGTREQTINVCAALGDIAITRNGPEYRLAWGELTENGVFVEPQFLEANGATISGSNDPLSMLPEVPATFSRNAGFIGIWIPDPWPEPTLVAYLFNGAIQTNWVDSGTLVGPVDLTVQGVPGKYYRSLRGLNGILEMQPFTVRFSSQVERENSTLTPELKSGNLYVNRANEELISHLDVEAGQSFLEVFELLENGTFDYSATQIPDPA